MFYEYMYDIASMAQEAGLNVIFHSNGSMREKPLRDLLEHIDAVTVDLKAFTDDFYRVFSRSSLSPGRSAFSAVCPEAACEQRLSDRDHRHHSRRAGICFYAGTQFHCHGGLRSAGLTASALSVLLAGDLRGLHAGGGRTIVMIAVLAVIVLAFPAVTDYLHLNSLEGMWPEGEIKGYHNSPYGNIVTLSREGEKTVLYDGRSIMTLPHPDTARLQDYAYLAAAAVSFIAYKIFFTSRSRRANHLVYAIFTSGGIAMAFDLFTIFAFQSLFGHIYQLNGLVIAAFMGGIYAGGRLAGRDVRRPDFISRAGAYDCTPDSGTFKTYQPDFDHEG